ncbi:MAG: pyridoxamine 5'-phosphate oxidase family protein [Gammaproteobacteria bacterium]|nr:pyridoxamine 5'-phosphate oxidase family protein [Gammaproteobacteria bacterium]
MHNNPTVFSTEAGLRELLGHPMELAARKAIPYLDKYCKAFIERAPFLTLATADAAGRVDVSPRGDQPGFVLILDDNTLFLPERPGNARYDSLVNIIANPRVGLLFFVPGFEDMLRVNGQAQLIHDEALVARCAVRGKEPRLGIRVTVEEAYLHCAKAIKRSQLWSAEVQRDRSELPSLGKMVLEQTAAADTPPSAELIRTVDEYIEDNYLTKLY